MRNIARFVLTALLALVSLTAAAWTYVSHRTDRLIADAPQALAPAQAGLVLGTSQRLRSGAANPYFTGRIRAAAALFAAGKVRYLIVSGSQAHGGRGAGGYDEPADMRDALIASGVPAARIYRDYAGFRTLDSVLRAREVFGQDRVIVVSQRFHLQRALYLAERHGLAFQGLAADDVPLGWGWPIRLREAGSRLRAVGDIATDKSARFGGPPIRLGADPPT
ncbi:SanA/YdcF family protein [Phenylobacterium montanum]|uniref:YdcF family protein n=1 Tax=Phenylobacterium montanum TaxID=2823693 RepID=A0A975G1T4_9CAUL|nr:ElyC/SanA/YdcF family protein [Caulobacter sp. S6]QUD88932.1 YdcF family protein [Caulobacter sp. S6]